MANYEIQQIDIDMLKSKFNTVWIKLELANIYENINGTLYFNSEFKPIADISGELTSGSLSCDSTSDIRRNLNVGFFIKDDSYKIGANKKIWLNKFIIAYLGVGTYLVENIRYYPLGVYIMNNASYSYSSNDNSLSLSCTDLVALLNGDRDGIIPGMQTMKIEAAPEICPATLSVNDTNKLININITSDSYQPLENTEGDTAPYFDCMIGFNIKSYDLPLDSYKYDNYGVSISINNFKQYEMREYDKKGNIVTFNTIHIGQDYVCNFAGNSSDNYCFIFYGKPNTISGAMTKTIEQFSPFKYLIETIGSDVINVDGSNPTYIPYDLEFNTGANQWEVITKLRDLYSGWQTVFDVYGVFICNKIPTCENDEIMLTDEVFEPLIISEKQTYDFTSVKNITEVWGKCQETDRYDDSPIVTIDSVNNKIIIDLELTQYACDADGKHNDPYQYSTSELLGFTMPDITDNQRATAIDNNYSIYLRINYKSDTDNNLSYLPEILLVDDYTNKNITTLDKLLDGIGYCIQPKYADNSGWYAIFCGEFQVHAVCMLVDKQPNEEKRKQDKIKYNCQQISYIYNQGNVAIYDSTGNIRTYELTEECPYTIEKCGEINQSLSGNDYEQIYTTDLARQRAEYEAWKAGRLTDSITIETRLIPFLDVNLKIKYKSIHTGQVDTYIIDKVSHSFDNFTTTIEMHKFYATYPYIVNN